MNPAQYNRIEPPEKAHIQLKPDINPEIFALLVQICPAGLYWQDENGMHYNYAGCLECGACRIIGGENAFVYWNLPPGGKGVDYSQG